MVLLSYKKYFLQLCILKIDENGRELRMISDIHMNLLMKYKFIYSHDLILLKISAICILTTSQYNSAGCVGHDAKKEKE